MWFVSVLYLVHAEKRLCPIKVLYANLCETNMFRKQGTVLNKVPFNIFVKLRGSAPYGL